MNVRPIILCSLLVAYGAFVAGCSLEGTPERAAGNRSRDAETKLRSDGADTESRDRPAQEAMARPAKSPAANAPEAEQKKSQKSEATSEEPSTKGKESTGHSSAAQSQSGSKAGNSSGGETEQGSQTESIENLWTRKQGHDWPTFLGPTGDSKSTETGLVTPWPEGGPRILWQRLLGTGYGIGSVSRGRFFQFDRLGDEAQLLCLHAETGKILWKFSYPTSYADLYGYNGGPRASPVVDDDRVYILGAEGMLHCLQVVDGRELWRVDTKSDFGVVQNFFGVGGTPVVDGDLLIVMVGGADEDSQRAPPGQLDRILGNGSGIVAFDKRTGKVRYKITDELASYCTPRVVSIGDRRWCFALCRNGLVGFEPQTGRVDFEFPWRARILESVNASTPVIVGNQVFISETYGPGSALLKIEEDRPTVVWDDSRKGRDKSMKCHWNTPIHIDGYLYGCSGRNEPDSDMRCIDWQTGKVQWVESTRIRNSLLYVDGHFISLAEDGVLQLIRVNPEKFDVVSTIEELRDKPSGEESSRGLSRLLLRSPCWSAPILSHGLLYVRGNDRLVCLEVIPEPGG